MVFEISSSVGKTLSLFSIWPFHIDSRQAMFRFLYLIQLTSDKDGRRKSNEQDHADKRIRREECSVHPAQVPGRDQSVLVQQQNSNQSDADQCRPSEAGQTIEQDKCNKCLQMEQAGYPQ